jgi:RHS repeat-associated protein
LISGWSNGILSTVRSYEPNRDLITAVENRAGTDLISRFDYENDAIGRRTQRIDHRGAGVPPSITNTFGYNPRSELTSATMGTNAYGYVFDSIGNRTEATNNAEVLAYQANALNQYTNITDGIDLVPTYDDDGNLTQDGRFDYTWNGENRLIQAETRDDLPAAVPRVKIEYAYDHQGRRIAAATAAWTNDAWQAVAARAFLYDGWNVIRETVAVGSGSPQTLSTNLYTWGLDLSGSLQGAGGIGGLLAASLEGTNAIYCYDANGNLGQLVSPDGELLAHYEYSPFGETIVSTVSLAKANLFRFSTKHWDDLTGLGYWGYRYYHPDMGRWLSRDPIEEEGAALLREPLVTYRQRELWREGRNSQRGYPDVAALYVAVGNNAVRNHDSLGLMWCNIMDRIRCSRTCRSLAVGYPNYSSVCTMTFVNLLCDRVTCKCYGHCILVSEYRASPPAGTHFTCHYQCGATGPRIVTKPTPCYRVGMIAL